MGAHVLAIKDMGGLCQPRAAAALVKALKEEVGLPLHFHTHDTSGIAAASVLAAIEAGVDAVDGAIDAMSGLTSQPNLGFDRRGVAIRSARHRARSGQDCGSSRPTGNRFAAATSLSKAISARAPPKSTCTACRAASTPICANRRASLGLDDYRWPEVAHAYSQVNEMFGDIVKVTPTSKVVGDMAITMVTSGLTRDAVLDPAVEIAFPDSVVHLFHGDLGQPAGGFPPGLQRKILGGRAPLSVRARRIAGAGRPRGGAQTRGSQSRPHDH